MKQTKMMMHMALCLLVLMGALVLNDSVFAADNISIYDKIPLKILTRTTTGTAVYLNETFEPAHGGFVLYKTSDLFNEALEKHQINLKSFVKGKGNFFAFDKGVFANGKPLIQSDGELYCMVANDYEGSLGQLIVHDAKGVFVYEYLQRIGVDGHYLIELAKGLPKLSQLPYEDDLIWVSRQSPYPVNNPLDLGSLDKNGIRSTKAMNAQKEIIAPLKALFDKAKSSAQINLQVVSAHRGVALQQVLFTNKSNSLRKQGVKNPELIAQKSVNPPGFSEHHTGFAVDVLTTSITTTKGFYNSKAANWLEKNAHLYGFVVRYPEGKTPVTGIIHEPWHLRYVGKMLAPVLVQEKLTLDEWMIQSQKGKIYKDQKGQWHYFAVYSKKNPVAMFLQPEKFKSVVRYMVSADLEGLDFIINVEEGAK